MDEVNKEPCRTLIEGHDADWKEAYITDSEGNELMDGEVLVDENHKIVFARTSKTFTPTGAEVYLQLDGNPIRITNFRLCQESPDLDQHYHGLMAEGR